MQTGRRREDERIKSVQHKGGCMEWFWYRLNKKNEAVLLRAFGTEPAVKLPEKIGGHVLTELSDYCFSGKEKYTGDEEFLFLAGEGEETRSGEEEVRFYELLEKGKLCALAGDFIKEVTLSGAVRKIGKFAFYQCHHLESITFEGREFELGGDAFMNCGSLKKFQIYALPQEPTGLRQILAQQDVETEVYFLSKEAHMVTGAVLFPEYSEKYDLIGPAHIFELNIEGEGFRARQCFEDGIFRFQKYDQIFSQAKDTEEERTLCRMAALRLGHPVELREEAKQMYTEYLLSHMECFLDSVLAEKKLELLKSLGENGNLGKDVLENCLKKAVKSKWTEGIRLLLMWKEEWRKEEEDAYGFEEF